MFSHGFEGQIDCLKCGNGFMPETPKALDLNMMYESFGNVGEDEFKSVTAKVKDALDIKETIDLDLMFAQQRDFCSSSCYMKWAESKYESLEQEKDELITKVESLEEKHAFNLKSVNRLEETVKALTRDKIELLQWRSSPYKMLWKRGFVKRYYNRLVHPKEDSHLGDFSVKMFLLFGSFYFMLRILEWSL